MNEFMAAYFSGPYINAISLALGFLGIGYAVYVQKKNPIKKGLLYRSKGLNIVNKLAKDIPSLDIRFANEQINVLSETIIHFWNSGNAGITFSDIPPTAQISLIVPNGCKILTCSVIVKDGPGVDFEVPSPIGQQSVPLNIRSIERRKGAILKILHTAPNPNDAKLGGVITDYGAPKFISKRLTVRTSNTIFDVILLSFVGVATLVIIWSAFKANGVGAAVGALLLVCLPAGFITLLLGALLETALVRIHRRLVTKSVWAYERDELSSTMLELIGEKK